ncbi:MAG: hypothetical protein ACLPGW_06475 [Roseiarcus sp.]
MRTVSKTLVAATAALALVSAVPTQAAANPAVVAGWWIVAAIAGGVVVGAAVTHPEMFTPAAAPAPMPAVSVTNAPTTGCYWTHGRVHGVWRRVQVCD